MAEPRLNWQQLLLAVLVPTSAELIWVLYNSYVPLWLQAGNPGFSAGEHAGLIGFGLSAVSTGVVLTLGNLLPLLINPVVGILSDTTRSRLGRRKPWYLFPAPVALTGLCLIPIFALRIDPALNGQAEALRPLLLAFLAASFALLVSLAVMRGPATVLLYDITPSQFRSTAAALSGVAGGLAGVLGAIAASALFGINAALPFWAAAGVVALSITLAATFVREPLLTESAAGEAPARPQELLRALLGLRGDAARSTGLLVLNTLFSFVAFGQMQAFTSSYGVSVLGMEAGSAALIYAAGGGTFILFSFPASMISSRWLNRKTTQLLGSLLFVPLGLSVYLFGSVVLIWPLVALLGAAWALIMVTQEPMMLDAAPSDLYLGSYSALIQVARMLGFVLSPLLGGWLVQALGSDYRVIWLVMAAMQTLSALVLLPVTRGEARITQSIKRES